MKTVTANGSKNKNQKIVGRQVRDRWCICKTSTSLEITKSTKTCVKHCP